MVDGPESTRAVPQAMMKGRMRWRLCRIRCHQPSAGLRITSNSSNGIASISTPTAEQSAVLVWRARGSCTGLRYRLLADVNLASTRRWAEPRADMTWCLRRMNRVCLSAREAGRRVVEPEGDKAGSAGQYQGRLVDMHDRRRGLALLA